MENKSFGFMMLGISAVIIAIIFLFQKALEEIVKASCGLEHGKTCPMYATITQQTSLAIAIVGIIVVIALILISSKPKERIIIKKIKEKKQRKRVDLTGFRPDEKKVFKIIKENKTMFQGDLIEETEFTKAKMTRILDKLEGHGLIERKRRGLTNIVVLKRE